MIPAQSRQYRIKSAPAVPRWRRVRKGTNEGSDCRYDQWRSAGRITAWPREETGNSSVAPCSSPMKIACHAVTNQNHDGKGPLPTGYYREPSVEYWG